jgi:hypothetical protein
MCQRFLARNNPRQGRFKLNQHELLLQYFNFCHHCTVLTITVISVKIIFKL